MLAAGDTAPEIDAVGSDGKRFVLSETAKEHLCTVVYFFPKAFTPGCSVETMRFRDNFAELTLAGAALVGISTDDLETQCRFAGSVGVPFPMIADADKRIGRAYGVLWPIVGLAKRVTFIVDGARRIDTVIHHELMIDKHAADVMRVVDRLLEARRAR